MLYAVGFIGEICREKTGFQTLTAMPVSPKHQSLNPKSRSKLLGVPETSTFNSQHRSGFRVYGSGFLDPSKYVE